MNQVLKPVIALLICIVLIFASMGIASLVQADFGRIEISTGYLEAGAGLIGYKLYVPKDISAPAPAVLNMHGYQNDKETGAAFSIELARRGIVVLAIDEYGHGSAVPGMRERGYGRYKLTNQDKPVSGPERFRIMMTFSILDFFKPKLSEGLKDSSMGGKDAYRFLAGLDFVDSSRIGITGHSMGTWSSWTVGAAYPSHRAIVLQCGELLHPDYYDTEKYRFNNVLLLQARYDEFDYFRDYRPDVMGLEKTELRYRHFMGQNAPVDWNRTYGSFTDGSARRMELINTNHRLTTHDGHALTAAMDWFTGALDAPTTLDASDHVYMIKEVLVMIAMLAALVSMLPALLLLSRLKFFAPIVRSPEQAGGKILPTKSRRRKVLTAVLISGFTFPFFTQLGHGLFPFPEKVFRMTVGNGFIMWLSFLMIVSLLMLIHWYKKGEGRRMGVSLNDLGLAETAGKLDWTIAGKSALAALLLTGMVYLFVSICTALFQLDFRFIWPFFKPFSLERFGQFFVYLPFYAAFFLVNAGVRLYGQLGIPERKSAAASQAVWWAYSVLVMLGGVFLIVLIEYIPFFLGFGPGADLLFTSLFGGPFMSVMILLIPQFMVFFFLSTYLYRKTGRVYVGSFVVAILASWVITGGSAMF